MAHVIIPGCIECGRCARECPEDAIYKSIGTSVINPNKCTDCASCVDVCPLELIVHELDIEPE